MAHSWLALFPPATRLVERDLPSGMHLRTYEHGEGDVAIFLHGFPELAVSWRGQLAGLPGHCVAPDMRGYGGSSAPKEASAYALKTLALDIAQLIDALGGQKVHLVGHDWGGAVAWEVARRHGEKLRTLTVCNCPPADVMLRELGSNFAQLRRSWYMGFFQMPGVPELLFSSNPENAMRKTFRAVAKNKEIFTPEVLAPYVEQARERGMRGGINYYRAAKFKTERWPPITVPTRMVWGLQDGALGPWFTQPEKYKEVCTQMDFVIIEESGHWVQQEATEKCNAAIAEHWATH